MPVELTRGPFTTAQGLASGLGRHRMLGADLASPFHGVRGQVGSGLSVWLGVRSRTSGMALSPDQNRCSGSQ